MREYQHLHEAGYNVLTYDARYHGQSGDANGVIFTWGQFESRDVAGSLNYAKSRPDTRSMTISLPSRCMGANATFMAMSRHPELFTGIKCLMACGPARSPLFAQAIAASAFAWPASRKAAPVQSSPPSLAALTATGRGPRPRRGGRRAGPHWGR
jgi:alpha-beta hydrolase superfamily lysophospholipase